MLFFCNNKYFDIDNEIISSSQTIKYFHEDINDVNAPINLPAKFENILCLLSSKLKIKITIKLELLDFYDFLNVDEKHISKIAKEIGQYVEVVKKHINMDNNVKALVLKYHPILNYDEKYGDKNINCEELPKYVTPYFHKNVKSFDIMEYCKYGNFKMVKKLYNPESQYDKNYLLNNSSENGHLNIVMFCVSKGANVNYKRGRPLINASRNGHLDIVKFLISKGADLHGCFEEPLIEACSNGHLDIVKFLVFKGANIENSLFLDFNKCTKSFGYLDMVSFVISIGDRSIDNPNNGALKHAVDAGHLEIIKFLITQGGDIHEFDDYPFRIACVKGYMEIAEILRNS